MSHGAVATWHAPLVTLWRGMEPQLRARAVALAVFCLAVTLMFSTTGIPAGSWIATSTLAIGSFGVSYLAARSVRRLVHDAQLSRLPRIKPHVVRVTLAQLLITGLAPALFILMLRGSEIQFCAIALAALFGQLAGTLPESAGVALVAVAAFLMVVLRNPIRELRQGSLLLSSALVAAALVSGMVGIWRVRLRSVPAQSVGGAWVASGALNALLSRERMGRQRRLTPTAVIRTFMQPPYAPVTLPLRALQVGVVFAMMCTPPVLAFALGSSHAFPELRRLFHALWPATVWLTGLLIWAWILRGQMLTFRGRSADLDELALLPGFGSAAMQRRHFYHASLIAPALLLSIVIALPLASMLWDPGSVPIYMRIAFVFSLLPALLVFSWQLPGHQAFRQTWILVPIMAASQSFSVFYSVRGLTAHQAEIFVLALLAGWALVYLVAIVVLGFKSRWLADRPHPFIEMAQ